MSSEPNEPKRFFRSSSEKVVSGVCGGIADYFNLDPNLVRLGWVLLTVFTAVVPGIVGYIVVAAVIPEAPGEPVDVN